MTKQIPPKVGTLTLVPDSITLRSGSYYLQAACGVCGQIHEVVKVTYLRNDGTCPKNKTKPLPDKVGCWTHRTHEGRFQVACWKSPAPQEWKDSSREAYKRHGSACSACRDQPTTQLPQASKAPSKAPLDELQEIERRVLLAQQAKQTPERIQARILAAKEAERRARDLEKGHEFPTGLDDEDRFDWMK